MRAPYYYAAILAGLLLPNIADAGCGNCYYSSNGYVTCDSSCGSPPPPEPASSKTPHENLEILADRAKSKVKELEATWFSSGKSLSEEREKVAIYKRMLDELEAKSK